MNRIQQRVSPGRASLPQGCPTLLDAIPGPERAEAAAQKPKAKSPKRPPCHHAERAEWTALGCGYDLAPIHDASESRLAGIQPAGWALQGTLGARRVIYRGVVRQFPNDLSLLCAS
jgi:hypothetical protein